MQKRIATDGYEITFTTNHLGPFLLTHLIMDLLTKSNEARIIIVSSNVCRLGYKNFGNFQVESLNGLSYLKNYAISKYANVLFCKELAKRLNGENVTVNILHPGIVKTKMLYNVEWYYKLGFLIFGIFFKTPEEGAQTQIYLAVSDEVKGMSGKYFMDCQECDIRKWFKQEDESNGKILWMLSEQLVNLESSECL